MNKRIEKRHKRQVARARERVRLSEPDLRTPEQVKAAREAISLGMASSCKTACNAYGQCCSGPYRLYTYVEVIEPEIGRHLVQLPVYNFTLRFPTPAREFPKPAPR